MFTISGKLMTDSQKRQAREFKSECTQQSFYTTGEKPPKDGKPETWYSRTAVDPEPLNLKLASIDKLGSLKQIASPAIIANFRRALKEYCSQLKSEGSVSSCSAPGPDPPFPKS